MSRINTCKTLFIFSLFFFCSSLANANSWTLNKNDEGIQVFLRDTPNTAIKSFKGTMTVNSRLSSVLAVLEDISSFPRWVHNCRSAKILRDISETKALMYVVTSMPWPVIDRDAVYEASRTQNRSNKRIDIKLIAKPNMASKVANKVRINNMQGSWILMPVGKNKTEVTYELTVDPGGNIPKWIVNSMVVDIPFYTLQNLRKVSKEDKYKKAVIKGVIE